MQSDLAPFAKTLRALREKITYAITQRFTEEHGDTRRENSGSIANSKAKKQVQLQEQIQLQNQMHLFLAGFANSLRALREKITSYNYTEIHGVARRYTEGEFRFNCKFKSKKASSIARTNSTAKSNATVLGGLCEFFAGFA